MVNRTVSEVVRCVAELAFRIRDQGAKNQFDGHRISRRIGINSGHVVVGIVGTHKFAYDLWGDVVKAPAPTFTAIRRGLAPGKGNGLTFGA